MPIMSWALSDLPNHKLGHAWQFSIIKQKWKYETRPKPVRKARENCTTSWLRLHGTCSYCYSASHSVKHVTSWPPFLMTCYQRRMETLPKRSACYAATSQKWMTAALQPPLGVALKMLMKENPPRMQSIWLFTLLGLRWPDDRIHAVL